MPKLTFPIKPAGSFPVLLLVLTALPFRAFAADTKSDDQPELPEKASTAIIQKYMAAQLSHEDSLRGASMQVDIDAAVPGLKERGRLSALRKISKLGQITYQKVTFQGDNSVKKDVIARFLEAEKQGQGDQNISVNTENYRFKYKGVKGAAGGEQAYVFQLSPRRKKVGLWKGQLWLDSKTYLPVVERGHVVKNPSIFFKKVDFERDFIIRDGISIPQHMSFTIDVRLIGKVELNIAYSDFDPNGAEETADAQSASISESATH